MQARAVSSYQLLQGRGWSSMEPEPAHGWLLRALCGAAGLCLGASQQSGGLLSGGSRYLAVRQVMRCAEWAQGCPELVCSCASCFMGR